MEEKYCPGCEEVLDVSNFGPNKSRKDGLQNLCRNCKRKYDGKRYKEKSYLQKEAAQKNREKIRKLFISYKKTLRCSNCGEDRWYVLDFHHINPLDKVKGISVMVNGGLSFKKIMEEIKKCTPLCRNCHAEVHYLEKENDAG